VRLALAAASSLLISVVGYGPQEPDAFLAFRFDSQRVVATLKSDIRVSLPQLGRDLPQPATKFGYQIFDLPSELQSRVPPSVRPGDRWSIHTAAGQVFDGTVERVVLGEAQCSRMIAAVVKIDDRQAWSFSSVRSKYYVADQSARPMPGEPAPPGELPETIITPEIRRTLDTSLARLLAAELPKVRAETEERVSRAASSADRESREWARGLLAAQTTLGAGGGALTYDAQPYRLTPDGTPMVFVRATWRAGAHPAFAVAAWVRADTGEIVWRDLRPTAHLRSYEFRHGLSPEQIGLVLNVVDRDGDGWAEVVLVQVGYESVDVSLREARSGFRPSGIGYYYGC
jgi:hypothetical protein